MKFIKQVSIKSLTALAALTVLSISLSSCGGGQSARLATAEEQFDRAKKRYDDKDYFRSAEEFQKVVYNFPGSQLVDTAQYFLSMSYMIDKQYELAAVEFGRLIKNYPRSPYAVECRYRIGHCFFKAAPGHYGLDQTEVTRSIRLLEDFMLDYPESEFVTEAQASILSANTRLAQKTFSNGMVYMHMRVFTAAEKYFQLVIDMYGNTSYAADALYRMAEARYKLREWDKAAQSANSFVALYPQHKEAEKAMKLIGKIEKDRAKYEPPAKNDSIPDADPDDNAVNSFVPRSEK